MELPTAAMKERRHWYEIVCNTLGRRFFEIPLGKRTIQDLSEKLKFCDLNIEPNAVYATSIITVIIGLVIGIVFSLLGFPVYGLLMIGAGVGLAVYFIYYPSIMTRYLRIQASSELVLSILYMIISLRLVPNLENAVKFAARNLRGPIGRDLKRMLWDLETGKYLNAGELLDDFGQKWKEENMEFYQAIDMIKTSMLEKGEKREHMLDESISVLLRGNMERMKNYTYQLKNPLMITTMLGITLPILTVIMFPIMTIFMAETIKPIMLVIFYNIILPIIVYFIMSDVLRSMPIQFRVVDISLHPDAHPIGKYNFNLMGKRVKIPLLPIAILIGLLIIGIGFFITKIPTEEPVALSKIGGGLIILWGLGTIPILYSFFSYYKNIEIREEIKEIEEQFDEAMFQWGHILYTGQSIEASMEKLCMSMSGLKIEKMFKRVLSNIRRFGFTMKKAFFDEKVGIVRYYPSYMIRNILRVIVDSLEKGMAGTAKTMISIAQYLKSVDSVETHMKEELDETTSNMSFMMKMLAPITCGIVVGMATIMTMVLFRIVSILSSVTGLSTAVPQLSSPGMIESIVDVKKIMPAEVFLVVVGGYMLEIVVLLSTFLTTLQYGGDPLDKYKLIVEGSLLGLTIFTFSILVIYFIFGGIIGMMWPS